MPACDAGKGRSGSRRRTKDANRSSVNIPTLLTWHLVIRRLGTPIVVQRSGIRADVMAGAVQVQSASGNGQSLFLRPRSAQLTLGIMTTHAALREVLDQRVMVMDGAMGTALQAFKLKAEDFVGERFQGHPKSLQGNNDILTLTRPDVVRAVHRCVAPPLQ